MLRKLAGHGVIALLLQILVCIASALLLLMGSFALTAEIGGLAYAVCMWALYPLIGAAASAVAVRMGLHHYLAWIAPGVCLVAVHFWLLNRLPMSPGMWLLATLLGFVGAAAGEVSRKRRRKKPCPKS